MSCTIWTFLLLVSAMALYRGRKWTQTCGIGVVLMRQPPHYGDLETLGPLLSSQPHLDP